MKILGVSGGRKDGNNDAMCREALMGAQEVGAEIEFIRLLDLDLRPCTGCNACTYQIMQGKKATCTIKDDFAWLNDKLLDADGVIFTIPIFEKGALAAFKILNDRFGGPNHDRGLNTLCKIISEKNGNEGPDPRLFRDDKFVSFIAIGGSDWNTRVSVDERLLALVPIWKVVDDEVFAWSLGIVVEDEKVAKCHEIGVNIANACADPEQFEYKGEKGICPHCNSRNFFLNDDCTKAICELCGIEGTMKIVDGTMKFEFTEEAEKHAHDTLSGKMMHAEDIGRFEAKLSESKKSPEYKIRMNRYRKFIQATKPEK